MKAYLLDLDGTLADSRPGLYPSFRSAIKAIGVAEQSDARLARFLGSPLPEMFRALKPGVSKTEIDAGIKAFRSVYEREGIARNRLYPGVPEMLTAIVGRDGTVWVVTSKPEAYALQVVKHLELDRYCAGVIGAGLDETDTKTGLIRRALLAAKVASGDAVMVGDRHYDIAGALENEVQPIGALWGYGSHDELFGAGCRQFARSPDEFREVFVEGKARSAVRPSRALG